MKALLSLAQIRLSLDHNNEFSVPSCFFPVMGKAFLQHVIEYLQSRDIEEIHIYLSDEADQIESFLGDGTRWGVSITFHLLKRTDSFLERIRKAPFVEHEELFLLGSGLTLPGFQKEDLQQIQRFIPLGDYDTEDTDDTGDAEDAHDDRTGEPETELSSEKEADEKAMQVCPWMVTTIKALMNGLNPETAEKTAKRPMLSVLSFSDYNRTRHMVLDRQFPELIHFGRLLREGIWLGQGTVLPKSITLIPPIYIGRSCRIEEGAIIGPYAEIGRGSYIGSDSYIKESLIFPGSYIGSDLDIQESIVKENTIVHTGIGAVYTSFDNNLLSSMDSSGVTKRPPGVSLLSRCTAAVVWLLSLPLQFCILLGKILLHAGSGRGRRQKRINILQKFRFVHIPLSEQQAASGNWPTFVLRAFTDRDRFPKSSWRHFFLFILPALPAVIRGDCRIIGQNVRTAAETEALSRDWKEVYTRSHAGLISELDTLYRNKPPEEVVFATEMFYAVHDARLYNIRIGLRYIRNLFIKKHLIM